MPTLAGRLKSPTENCIRAGGVIWFEDNCYINVEKMKKYTKMYLQTSKNISM
jgi:hypothetical protein